MQKYTLQYIKDNNLILFEAISGSIAYGTNTPTSDTDIRGVFICELDDILSGDYPEQINDETNDVVFYELGRFLNLVSSNNPNILELLNAPEDCILSKNSLFDLILEHKDRFVTKKCANSFYGYAISQIKKASGLDKKQNWESERTERKDPIDFCHAIIKNETKPLKEFIEDNELDQLFCGVTSIPHARDLYALFYDGKAHCCFSDRVSETERERFKNEIKESGESFGLGYKGLSKIGDESKNKSESNSLRLSSIPKGEQPIVIFSYNKDGYTMHCEQYRQYQEWLAKRNTKRYVETKNHGQKIDSKNLMHCHRLLRMASEIASGQGIIVRRPDAEWLLRIRRGEFSLDELLDQANEQVENLNEIFDRSELPDSVDSEFVNNLIVGIRREFYHLSPNK